MTTGNMALTLNVVNDGHGRQLKGKGMHDS